MSRPTPRLLLLTLLVCGACAPGKTSSSDAPGEVEPSNSPAVEPPETKAPVSPPTSGLTPLTDAQMIATLTAAGCPEGKASATGCEVCPGAISRTLSLGGPPLGYSPVVTSDGIFELTRKDGVRVGGLGGEFALGGDSLLFFDGCALPNDPGERRGTSLHVVGGGALVGTLERALLDGPRVRACAAPRDSSGRRHLLCVLASGRQGVEVLEVRSAHAPTSRDFDDLEPDDHHLRNAPPSVESEGEWSDDGDTLTMPATHHLSFTSVEDLDGDGDDDVVMRRGVDERWHLIQTDDGVFLSGSQASPGREL